MKQAFVLLLSLFLLVGCKNKEEKVETTTAPAEPVRIVAIGRVEPERKITSVGSEVNGVIKKIYVSAGDKVRKGQVLIEFAHDYEDAKLLQTKAKETTQKAEIQNAQAQINAAKIKSENLRKTYERTQKIFDEGAETKQVLENTKADYDQASKDVERFTASLNSAESKLNEIKADAQLAAVDIERRKVKAPADGLILTMDLTEGSAVSFEKPLFEFAPKSALTVLCEVDEMWADKIKLGQKAIIRTQGMDDKLGEGEIVYLSPYLKKKSLFSDDSSNMEDRRVREVRVRLSGNPDLLINSRVEVVVDLKQSK